MYISRFIFPLLCHRATSSWAVPPEAQGLTQHPLFLIMWGSLGIAGITVHWFRHDHFHISFSSGKSWDFFPLICVPLVETTLCGQQMFHSASSAKGFNWRSKKWCLFWPLADGPHVLRTVFLWRQPVAVPRSIPASWHSLWPQNTWLDTKNNIAMVSKDEESSRSSFSLAFQRKFVVHNVQEEDCKNDSQHIHVALKLQGQFCHPGSNKYSKGKATLLCAPPAWEEQNLYEGMGLVGV